MFLFGSRGDLGGFTETYLIKSKPGTKADTDELFYEYEKGTGNTFKQASFMSFFRFANFILTRLRINMSETGEW